MSFISGTKIEPAKFLEQPQFIKQYPKHADMAAKTKLQHVAAEKYYGKGYQDVSLRVPSIRRAETELGWKPSVNLKDGLKRTLDFYLAS